MNEDKASRYNRLKRRTGVISVVWSAVILALLLVSGGSLTLRHLAERTSSAIASGWLARGVGVAVYVALLMAVSEVAGLPLAFYSGFTLERRYGLSKESLGGWMLDQVKGFGVGWLLGSIAALLVYFCIGRFGDAWWLPAGAAFALLIVGLVNLAPVLLLPLFYSVKPLAREELSRRLLALAERAGARVLGTYEWGLSAKTTKANAALTGVGGTRRILVSDTMLAAYSDDEIEVVLAHELAHHVHGDIWKGVALESALVLGGLFVAARALAWLSPALGLAGPSDVAGLPLLLLAAGAVSLVLVPLAHALSRWNERRADRFALDLTRRPDAFISAMRRLGQQNLAEDEPSKIVEWLFYSHPPIRARIQAAERYSNR